MATTNPYIRFKKLFEGNARLRAKVVAVDATLGRVRIQYSAGTEWLSGTGYVIDDHVMVEGDRIVSKLPELPYDRVDVD